MTTEIPEAKQLKEEEENYDFDFSMYENEVEETEDTREGVANHKSPNVTGLRSKFSNGEASLEILAELEKEIVRMAVKVGARTQDLQLLWKFYGSLNEFWTLIKYVFGKIDHDKVKKIKNDCLELLDDCANKSQINKEVHNYLLYFRDTLVKLKQYANLGFEVEKSYSGTYNKIKKQIV